MPRMGMPSEASCSMTTSHHLESTIKVPSLFSLDKINEVRPEDFNDWVERLHVYYGQVMPDFVQEREDYWEGNTVAMVKASANGQYPKVHSETPQYEAQVCLWSRELIFWTVTTNSRRYIIGPGEKDGRTSYRRWRGTRLGFDGAVFAFKKDVAGPLPTGEYLTRHCRRS